MDRETFLYLLGMKKLATGSRQAKKLTQVPEMVFDSSLPLGRSLPGRSPTNHRTRKYSDSFFENDKTFHFAR